MCVRVHNGERGRDGDVRPKKNGWVVLDRSPAISGCISCLGSMMEGALPVFVHSGGSYCLQQNPLQFNIVFCRLENTIFPSCFYTLPPDFDIYLYN